MSNLHFRSAEIGYIENHKRKWNILNEFILHRVE